MIENFVARSSNFVINMYVFLSVIVLLVCRELIRCAYDVNCVEVTVSYSSQT